MIYSIYIYIRTYIYICVTWRGHECHSHILGAILWQQTATCPYFGQRRSDLGDVHICVDVKQGRQFHCFLCTEWELRKLRQSLCQWLLTLPETQQIPTIVTRVPQLHTSKPITWWHLEVSQGFIESMFCDRSRHNGHCPSSNPVEISWKQCQATILSITLQAWNWCTQLSMVPSCSWSLKSCWAVELLVYWFYCWTIALTRADHVWAPISHNVPQPCFVLPWCLGRNTMGMYSAPIIKWCRKPW